jgi:RNA polymerase subunit RPABC4/transcription elongation factor Spt4
MSDHRQNLGEPFSEKMRLIRFRMKREETRFSDEIRLVPRWLVMLVIGLFVTAEVVLTGASWLGWFGPPGPDAPENAPMVAGIVAAVGIPLGCLILLIGYVSQDAKRRGMNAALWTLLVIMLLPAWLLTGFIIYFLIREPLPYHCTGCGTMVSARYNYCPNCKCNLRPACPQCQREVSDRDRYCPYCGFEVARKETPAGSVPEG